MTDAGAVEEGGHLDAGGFDGERRAQRLEVCGAQLFGQLGRGRCEGTVVGGCNHQSADPLFGDGGHETIRILRLDGATLPTGE